MEVFPCEPGQVGQDDSPQQQSELGQESPLLPPGTSSCPQMSTTSDNICQESHVVPDPVLGDVIQGEILENHDAFEDEEEQMKDEVVEESREDENDDREPLSVELQHGFRILTELMSESHKSINWPFMDPVDAEKLGLYDYHERVKKPMWIRRMKDKFENREYETITQFVGDMRLMFENCYRYNGPDHYVSKRGQKLETVMEQKLALLSREIREKTSVAATASLSAEENVLIVGTSTRRRKVLHGHDSSALLNQLRQEEKEREREARRQTILDRQKEREAFLHELQEWEDSLYPGTLQQQKKSCWEIVQIGHFMFLCSLPLNIGEVMHYELEHSFMMPRESSTMQRVMTALLSTPYQRTRLDKKPMMPYKVWEEKLRTRLRYWYKIHKDNGLNAKKTMQKLGLEEKFFKVCGHKNPLEKKKFHELTFYQRVWIVKGLCDWCLETQESIQESIEAQPIDEQREYLLGFDGDGNRYIHFPQFCGADLRIYRQSPFLLPQIDRPLLPAKSAVRSISPTKKRSDTSSGRKKKKKKEDDTPPVPVTPRTRDSRLRQNPRQIQNVAKSDSESESSATRGSGDNESDDEEPPLKNPRVERLSRSLRCREAAKAMMEANQSDTSRESTPTRTLKGCVGRFFKGSRSNTPSRESTPMRTTKKWETLLETDSRSSTPLEDSTADKNSIGGDGDSRVSTPLIDSVQSNGRTSVNSSSTSVSSVPCITGKMFPKQGSKTSRKLDFERDDREGVRGEESSWDQEKDYHEKYDEEMVQNDSETKALVATANCQPGEADGNPDVNQEDKGAESAVQKSSEMDVCTESVVNGAVSEYCEDVQQMHCEPVKHCLTKQTAGVTYLGRSTISSHETHNLLVNGDIDSFDGGSDSKIANIRCDKSLQSIIENESDIHVDALSKENMQLVGSATCEAKVEAGGDNGYHDRIGSEMTTGNSAPGEFGDALGHMDENFNAMDQDTLCNSDAAFLVDKLETVDGGMVGKGSDDECDKQASTAVEETSYVEKESGSEMSLCSTSVELFGDASVSSEKEMQEYVADPVIQIKIAPKQESMLEGNTDDKTKEVVKCEPVGDLKEIKKEADISQDDTDKIVSIKDETVSGTDNKQILKIETLVKSEDVTKKEPDTDIQDDALAVVKKELLVMKEEESSDDEDFEVETPEIGEFQLIADSVELLRKLTEQYAEQEPITIETGKKQRIITPPTRKRCVVDLHARLKFLLKELEPWESKLIAAQKRARIKMRKEQENYKEEPEPKEDVWESEESVSESSSEEESEEEKSNKDTESGTKLKQKPVKKQPPKLMEEDKEEIEEEELGISSRGRIRKRRIIPNNIEDQGIKKRKVTKENEHSPSPTPNILQRNRNLVSSSGTAGLTSAVSSGVSLLNPCGQTVYLNTSRGPTPVIIQTNPAMQNVKLNNLTLLAHLSGQSPSAAVVTSGSGNSAQTILQVSPAKPQYTISGAVPQKTSPLLSKTLANPAMVQALLQQQGVQVVKSVSAPVASVSMAKPAPQLGGVKLTVATSSISSTGVAPSPVCSNVAATRPSIVPNSPRLQFYNYNNVSQLPAAVFQQLLRAQGVKVKTVGTKTLASAAIGGGVSLPVTAVAPGGTTALTKLIQAGVLPSPTRTNASQVTQGSASPVVAGKGNNVSAVPHQLLNPNPENPASGQVSKAVPHHTVPLQLKTGPVQQPSATPAHPISASVVQQVNTAKPVQPMSVTQTQLNAAQTQQLANAALSGMTLISPKASSHTVPIRPAPVSPGKATSPSNVKVSVGMLSPELLARLKDLGVQQSTLEANPALIRMLLSPKKEPFYKYASNVTVKTLLERRAAKVNEQDDLDESDSSIDSKANVDTVVDGTSRLVSQLRAAGVKIKVEAESASSVADGSVVHNIVPSPLSGSPKLEPGTAKVVPQVGSSVVQHSCVVSTGLPQTAVSKTLVSSSQDVSMVPHPIVRVALPQPSALDSAIQAVVTTVRTSLPTVALKVSCPPTLPQPSNRLVTSTTHATKVPIPSVPQSLIEPKVSHAAPVSSLQGSLSSSAFASVPARSTSISRSGIQLTTAKAGAASGPVHFLPTSSSLNTAGLQIKSVPQPSPVKQTPLGQNPKLSATIEQSLKTKLLLPTTLSSQISVSGAHTSPNVLLQQTSSGIGSQISQMNVLTPGQTKTAMVLQQSPSAGLGGQLSTVNIGGQQRTAIVLQAGQAGQDGQKNVVLRVVPPVGATPHSAMSGLAFPQGTGLPQQIVKHQTEQQMAVNKLQSAGIYQNLVVGQDGTLLQIKPSRQVPVSCAPQVAATSAITLHTQQPMRISQPAVPVQIPAVSKPSLAGHTVVRVGNSSYKVAARPSAVAITTSPSVTSTITTQTTQPLRGGMLQQQPATVVPQQSARVLQQQAATVLQQQPATVLQQQPATVLQQQPATVLQQQPATVLQQQPATVLQQQPATVLQQQPATVLQQQPATVLQQQPATVLQQQPATVLQQQAATVVPKTALQAQLASQGFRLVQQSSTCMPAKGSAASSLQMAVSSMQTAVSSSQSLATQLAAAALKPPVSKPQLQLSTIQRPTVSSSQKSTPRLIRHPQDTPKLLSPTLSASLQVQPKEVIGERTDKTTSELEQIAISALSSGFQRSVMPQSEVNDGAGSQQLIASCQTVSSNRQTPSQISAPISLTTPVTGFANNSLISQPFTQLIHQAQTSEKGLAQMSSVAKTVASPVVSVTTATAQIGKAVTKLTTAGSSVTIPSSQLVKQAIGAPNLSSLQPKVIGSSIHMGGHLQQVPVSNVQLLSGNLGSNVNSVHAGKTNNQSSLMLSSGNIGQNFVISPPASNSAATSVHSFVVSPAGTSSSLTTATPESHSSTNSSGKTVLLRLAVQQLQALQQQLGSLQGVSLPTSLSKSVTAPSLPIQTQQGTPALAHITQNPGQIVTSVHNLAQMLNTGGQNLPQFVTASPEKLQTVTSVQKKTEVVGGLQNRLPAVTNLQNTPQGAATQILTAALQGTPQMVTTVRPPLAASLQNKQVLTSQSKAPLVATFQNKQHIVNAVPKSIQVGTNAQNIPHTVKTMQKSPGMVRVAGPQVVSSNLAANIQLKAAATGQKTKSSAPKQAMVASFVPVSQDNKSRIMTASLQPKPVVQVQGRQLLSQKTNTVGNLVTAVSMANTCSPTTIPSKPKVFVPNSKSVTKHVIVPTPPGTKPSIVKPSEQLFTTTKATVINPPQANAAAVVSSPMFSAIGVSNQAQTNVSPKIPTPQAATQQTSPAKFVLYNINGQLVTAQGIPVTVSQGIVRPLLQHSQASSTTVRQLVLSAAQPSLPAQPSQGVQSATNLTNTGAFSTAGQAGIQLQLSSLPTATKVVRLDSLGQVSQSNVNQLTNNTNGQVKLVSASNVVDQVKGQVSSA